MTDALKSPPKFENGSSLNTAWEDGRGRFLIDGFPRKLDQAHKFDDTVSLGENTFFFFFWKTASINNRSLIVHPPPTPYPSKRSANVLLCCTFHVRKKSC